MSYSPRPSAASAESPDIWSQTLATWPGATAAFLAVGLFASLLNLGAFGLISMEGMVIEGGHNMLQDGQWSVPVLYGEIYTYKPSFAYWVSAAGQRVLGADSEFVLRLPFALSGVLLGLVVLTVIGRLLDPRTGLFAALAATVNPMMAEKIRIAEFDGLLAVAVGIAVTAAVAALVSEKQRFFPWLVCYSALLAACLVKGTPALMAFAPGLLVAAFASGRFRQLFSLQHLAGAALFVAGLGLYLWLALDAVGPIFLEQPLEEARKKGVEWTVSAVLASTAKPLLILGSFLPWSLILLVPFVTRWAPSSEADSPGRLDFLEPMQRQVFLVAGGFLLGGLFSFLVVPTHEMRYYLPLTTAHAIAAGILIEACLFRALPRAMTLALKVLLGLVAVAVLVIAIDYSPSSWWMIALPCLILAVAGMFLPRSLGTTAVSLMVAVSLVVVVGIAFVTVPKKADKRDLRPAAEQLRPFIDEDETMYVVGPSDYAGKHSALYFYLEREVQAFDIAKGLPAGSLFLLSVPVEDFSYGTPDTWTVPEGTRAEELTVHESPRYQYRLMRMATDSQASQSSGG